MMRSSRWVAGPLMLGLLAGCLHLGLASAPASGQEALKAPPARRAAAPRALTAHLPAAPGADTFAQDHPHAGPTALPPAVQHRARHTAAGKDNVRRFTEVDLTARTKSSAQPDTATARLSPEARAMLLQLTDPSFLRRQGAAPPAAEGVRLALPLGTTTARPAAKAAPWSANTLLGNPTNMNDDYVTLATSPDGSVLYAAFSAVDLGSTDRDIHVARSLNQGLTWQVWELPSFTTDEYHPELAVDGGGYLHVVWIRADGVILRSRSSNPGDPSAWAWVKGLTVGEPCAVPSIAVTGAGDFAKVFIAANWLTVNWDYYQYEWTLVFMYSSNGGNTVTYDYFLPDGYPDYWPDVAMNAGTVHFVNAEQDAYTGQMEILIATDAYTGSFASPASFTGWTSSNAGYPRVACQGQDVYAVYQLDYTNGITSDGDIIYTYSTDAGASFFGPYGLVADEYDSVGPSLFVRGGVVGCAWLDAPNGGDEFHLAIRLASGHGAAEFFGDVEVVSDLPTVEPVFHAADAVLTGLRAHAAWSDRRDFPTQGRNVYTARRELKADLAAFTPAGWGDALVANVIRRQRVNGYTAAGDTNWVSFAFLNAGLQDITRSFLIDLELDGTTYASWRLDGGLPAGTYVPLEDFPLTGPAGPHTLTVRLDTGAQINEDDETDNAIARDFEFRAGDPGLRLRPSGLVTIINPYLKRAEALKLAQAPPLRRETWLDPVDPRLREAMAFAEPGRLLPVMIVPTERVDPAQLAAQLQGASRAARREAVAAAARTQVGLALEELRPILDAATKAGTAASPRALWLSGSLRAELAPATIAALAADPRVGRLWLDDVRSRAFGGPPATAGADGTMTAPVGTTSAPDKALAWHLQAIGADQAWAAGSTGAGVLVGHLDSGVAYDHPDLSSRLWNGGAAFPHHGWDAVDEDDDPYDGDSTWRHGTHTAGLIVGDGTAGTKTGVAPGARLMALRVVPGYQADLVEGMQFGLEHGVHLFSMSAGWSLAGSEVRAANRYNAEMLLAMDVPLFAAAGNGSPTGHYAVPTDIASPADCPGPWYAPGGGRSAVITVGGLTNTGAVETTSSYGPTSWNIANPYGAANYRDYPYPPGLMKPDLAAPGANVTSLAGAGGYVAYTGTSMACPQVAGAAAILLGASPGLDPAQLAEALETTATDITAAPATAGRDPYTGAGRISIPSALAGVPMGRVLEFTVQNTGNLPLVFGPATPGANWIAVDQPPAWLNPGDTASLAARIEPAGLLEGVHETFVAFSSNAPGSPHLLPVQLIYGDYATGVADDLPARHGKRLDGYPNPFNPRTTLRFALAAPARADLEVHDLAGRLVRRLLAADLPAGEHEVAWDGKDEAGRAVASGQYVARLRAGDGEPVTRKLMLVR